MSLSDMIYYASIGKTGKVLLQLKKGVDVNALNSTQETALYAAAKNGRISTIKALLKNGADPNIMNSDGLTAVIIASIHNHKSSVKALLKAGGVWFVAGSEDMELKRMYDSLPNKHLNDEKNINNQTKIHDVLVQTNSKSFIIPGMFKIQECKVHGISMAAKIREKNVLEQSENSFEIAEHEYEILRSLRHPNILQPYSKTEFDDSKTFILLTECVDFGNLYHIIHNSKTRIKPSIRNDILVQSIQACLFLHGRGLVHNFINSTSIFITKDWCVKLGNMEYASSNITQTKEMFPDDRKYQLKYMAPETVSISSASMFSDVYSFGCLIWEIFSRTIPWSWIEEDDIILMGNDDACSVCLPMQPCWPHHVRYIIHHCTQRKIEDRPSFDDIFRFFNDVCRGSICDVTMSNHFGSNQLKPKESSRLSQSAHKISKTFRTSNNDISRSHGDLEIHNDENNNEITEADHSIDHTSLGLNYIDQLPSSTDQIAKIAPFNLCIHNIQTDDDQNGFRKSSILSDMTSSSSSSSALSTPSSSSTSSPVHQLHYNSSLHNNNEKEFIIHVNNTENDSLDSLPFQQSHHSDNEKRKMIPSSLRIRHANNCQCSRSDKVLGDHGNPSATSHEKRKVQNENLVQKRQNTPRILLNRSFSVPSSCSRTTKSSSNRTQIIDSESKCHVYKQLNDLLVQLRHHGETEESINLYIRHFFEDDHALKEKRFLAAGASSIAFNEKDEEIKENRMRLLNEVYAVVGKPKRKNWAKDLELTRDKQLSNSLHRFVLF